MWLLLAILLPVVVIGKIVMDRTGVFRNRLFSIIQILLTYYLAFILLNYGIDKIFKAQFYLPEPNILFTPLGMLDRDMLYWSTMGVSYEYNLFLGFAEVIAAALMLIRKTRVLGLMMGSLILVNIVAVNFSFDISVKAFSLLLLTISLLLLAPFLKSFAAFFFLRKVVGIPKLPEFSPTRFPLIVKVALIGFVIAEALFPFCQNGIYNDDDAERPFLHGAYKVVESSDPTLRMFFIHRDGYLIFQGEGLKMKDYKLKINLTGNFFNLKDYDGSEHELNFEYDDSVGLLNLRSRDGDFYVKSKEVNWREMPALQRQFQLSI